MPTGMWVVMPEASRSWQCPFPLAQPLPSVSQVQAPGLALAAAEIKTESPGVAQGTQLQGRACTQATEHTLFLPTPNPHFTFPQESQQGPLSQAGRGQPSRLAGSCTPPEGLRPDQGPPWTQSWRGGRGRGESYCLLWWPSEGGALPSGGSESQGPTAPTLSKASICANQTEGEGWAPLSTPPLQALWPTRPLQPEAFSRAPHT